jgi:hypothetical protein
VLRSVVVAERALGGRRQRRPALLRQLRDAAVQLGDRGTQLLAANLMGRGRQLALQVSPCQTARLELASTLRIPGPHDLPGFPLLFLSLFHALGEAGFSIDEPFTGITHSADYTDLLPNSFTANRGQGVGNPIAA